MRGQQAQQGDRAEQAQQDEPGQQVHQAQQVPEAQQCQPAEQGQEQAQQGGRAEQAQQDEPGQHVHQAQQEPEAQPCQPAEQGQEQAQLGLHDQLGLQISQHQVRQDGMELREKEESPEQHVKRRRMASGVCIHGNAPSRVRTAGASLIEPLSHDLGLFGESRRQSLLLSVLPLMLQLSSKNMEVERA
jgi:hypothetical protein